MSEPAIPTPPRSLPDAEFMRADPGGASLWFVATAGQHGIVYRECEDGSVRPATGAELQLPKTTTTTERRATMPADTKTKKSPSKFQKLLAEGTDQELGEHLLATPTLADRTWKSRAGRKARKDGESRSDFIKRVLLAGS